MGHKKLEDMKKSGSYDELCDLKKDLIKIFASELHTKGVDDLDTKDCAEVADMIKDLAEAEKACMEACYYETVIKAMEKADEEDEQEGRMGYNAYRYANGRYAPKGRGTRRGYTPEMGMMNPYLYDPDFEEEIEDRETVLSLDLVWGMIWTGILMTIRDRAENTMNTSVQNVITARPSHRKTNGRWMSTL